MVYRKAAVQPTVLAAACIHVHMARSVVSATCFTQHYGHLQDGLYFNTKTKTLPPGLSLRGLGFYPRPVQLRFVVDKVSLVQVFIRALLFHCTNAAYSFSHILMTLLRAPVCLSVPHLNSDVTVLLSVRRLVQLPVLQY